MAFSQVITGIGGPDHTVDGATPGEQAKQAMRSRLLSSLPARSLLQLLPLVSCALLQLLPWLPSI